MDRTQGDSVSGLRPFAVGEGISADSEARRQRGYPFLVFTKATPGISAIGGSAQYDLSGDRPFHQWYEAGVPLLMFAGLATRRMSGRSGWLHLCNGRSGTAK